MCITHNKHNSKNVYVVSEIQVVKVFLLKMSKETIRIYGNMATNPCFRVFVLMGVAMYKCLFGNKLQFKLRRRNIDIYPKLIKVLYKVQITVDTSSGVDTSVVD